MRHAATVGGDVLDGQPDLDLVERYLDGLDSEFCLRPDHPAAVAEVAQFARSFPDLYARWDNCHPQTFRILGVLVRAELDLLAAHEDHRLPRPSDRVLPLASMEMGEVIALAAWVPPAGGDRRDALRRYKVRLHRLEALWEEAEETNFSIDGDPVYWEHIEYAEAVIDAAHNRRFDKDGQPLSS